VNFILFMENEWEDDPWKIFVRLVENKSNFSEIDT
jgi:hypothetical protein